MELLDALTDEPRSGEVIAADLGVSRAAISKAAKALQDSGIPVIVDRARGYSLPPGTPTPIAFTKARGLSVIETPYRYLGSTTSTQDALRTWAVDGAPTDAVVVAEAQTQGRGRRGRAWTSHPGASLTFSVLLRPSIPVASLGLISLAAGIATADAIGHGSTLKWPNDVLAHDGHKLAGILAESQTSAEEVDLVFLGIGVNVTGEAPEHGASVSEFDPHVRRVDLLVRILDGLDRWVGVTSEDPSSLLTAWIERSAMIGASVTAASTRDAAANVVGIATGLDPTGALIVATDVGEVTVHAGDVTLTPA